MRNDFSVRLRDVRPGAFGRYARALNTYAGAEHIELFPFQLKTGFRAARSVLERRGWEMLWVFARQSGKTELAATLAHFLAASPAFIRHSWVGKRGVDIGVFGPKEKQADIIFSRIKDKNASGFLQDFMDLEVYEIADRIEITGNSADGRPFRSRIVRSTASKSGFIEGLTLNLAIIDEAQDVDGIRIVKSIYPMLSTTMGSRVLLGSFTPEHYWYFMEQVPYMRKHPDPTIRRNLSIYDWTHRARLDPTYHAFVMGEIDRLGEDDPFIQTQFYCRYDVAAVSRFIMEPELFERLGHGVRVFTSDEPVSVGIDPAKQNDSTVVTVKRRRDNRILNWLEMTEINYREQERRIRDFLRNYNISAIVIEQNSPGTVLGDYLAAPPEELPPGAISYAGRLHLFHSSLQSKSDLYTQIQKLISDSGFSYPNDGSVESGKFKHQFLNLTRAYSGGYMKVDHPNGRDEHNDFPDSFAFSLAADSFVSPYFGDADPVSRRSRARPKAHFVKRGGY